MSGLYPPTKSPFILPFGVKRSTFRTLIILLTFALISQASFSQEQKTGNEQIPPEKAAVILMEKQQALQNQQQKPSSRPASNKSTTASPSVNVNNLSENNLSAEKQTHQAKMELQEQEDARNGGSVPGIDYRIITTGAGQAAYKITKGGRDIFTQSVSVITNTPFKNKIQAEKEAIVAARMYRANSTLTQTQLMNEVRGQVNSAGNTNSVNRDQTTMNTLADFTFNGGGGTIPSSGTASPYPSTIVVSGVPLGATVKSVTLTGLNHTWADDVDIVLQSPTGANVILMSDAGGSGDLINHNYEFNDAAASTLQDNAVQASGTYRPTNFGAGDNYPAPGPLTAPSSTTLSTFGSGNQNGTWSLFIVDDLGGDQGSWGSWSITFTEPLAACFPITITSQPSDTTACTFGVATFTVGAGPAGVDYNWQVDNGSGFVYLVNGGVYSGVNNATLTITNATLAMNGYQYRCVITCSQGGLPEISNPATLSVSQSPPAPTISPTSAAICPGGVATLSITSSQYVSPVTASSGTISVPIPDNSATGASHTLNVSGFSASTVASISVTFNITHTWDGDLDINLVAPNGNILNLVNNRGGSGDNFVNTVISSNGVTPIASGSAPFTGTFTADAALGQGPTGSVSNVTLFSDLFSTPNGNWTLAMRDGAGGDLGTLTSWSITITPAASVTVSSGAIALPIPDNNPNGAAHSLNVSGFPPVPVASMLVNFNITHTWDGDLEINLVAPNGNILNLVNNRGGSGDNFTNTIISSTGATPVSSGTAPFTGTFSPDAALGQGPTLYISNTALFSDLFSVPNGTWTLAIRDGAGADVGTLDSWSITLNPTIVPDAAVWTPATGLYNDAALTSPYVAGTYQTTVYASPAATTTYSAVISNGTCQSPPSNVTVTVNAAPVITGQPGTNGNACAGGSRTFSVTASGTSPTYQWQVNSGSGFVNITTGTPTNPSGFLYTGQTTNTLSLNDILPTMNGYIYRCIVNGACTPSDTSDEVTLVVNSLPSITVTQNNDCSPAMLTASGANTYTWAPATGLSATTGATVTANPTSNTTYTVTGTNTTTGCTNTSTVDVSFTPPTPVVSPAAPVICAGTVQQLSITSSSLPPVANTTSSGAISVPIPDNDPVTGASHDLVVSGVTGSVQSISVTFNITHTWDSDLDINLVAPNGNILNLVGARGGAGDNFTNTTISSASTTSLSTGTAPFTGTFAADGNIGWGPAIYASNVSTFASLFSVPNGTWKIAIADFAAFDVGTLNSWSITINYAAPDVGVWTPNGAGSGLFTDPAGTIVYTGTPANTVYANPASTTTYSVSVTNTGVATRTFSTGGSVTIPGVAPASTASGPGAPYPSVINVSGLPATAIVKSVVIKGVKHSFPSDLDILLRSPGNEDVVLMSDVGGSTDATGQIYTFNDGGNAMAATFNPTGIYKPTNSGATDVFPAPVGSITQAAPALSMFTADPNGSWSLYINDDAGADIGSISSWEIIFQLPNALNCTSPARTVTVTVHQPIVITQQPANRTACQGDNVSFSVTATGNPIAYQWQQSTNGGVTFTNINGATSATLNLTNVQPSMNGYRYRCILSNAGCGSVTTTPLTGVILTVNPTPTVGLSASPYLQLRPGLQTTLTTTSNPAGSSYAWYQNGTLVPSITTGSTIIDVDELGTWYVIVTDVNNCKNTTNSVTISALPTDNLFIYPNPNSGQFQVRYYTEQLNWPVTVSIFNAKGQRVADQQAVTTAPYTRINFDLSKNGAGVYVVEFRDPGGNRLAQGRVVIIR